MRLHFNNLRHNLAKKCFIFELTLAIELSQLKERDNVPCSRCRHAKVFGTLNYVILSIITFFYLGLILFLTDYISDYISNSKQMKNNSILMKRLAFVLNKES